MSTQLVGLGLVRELVLPPRVESLHLLAWGTALGVQVWVTFIGGVIQYKELPRQVFGRLQSKLFPPYFTLQAISTAICLATFTTKHPEVLSGRLLTDLSDGKVNQVWTLLTILGSVAINKWWVGPIATNVMFERHEQEKIEGKDYRDEGVSDKMKELSTRFGKLHGISSSLNLLALGAAVWHGLWLGRFWVQ